MYRLINILLQFVRVIMVARLIYLSLIYITDFDEKENSKRKGKNALIIYACIESAVLIPDLILDYYR